MALKGALVVTTVNDPVLLGGYCDNFARFGRPDEVVVTAGPGEHDIVSGPTGFTNVCEMLRFSTEGPV